MNVKAAATVGTVALVLSALAGLLGGVPLLDLTVRAMVWGVLGAAGAVGAEWLLRRFVPELFEGSGGTAPESVPERAVDITLDDEPVGPRPFVEEIDEESGRPARSSGAAAEVEAPVQTASGSVAAESPGASDGEGEMPEIGSFLDAFKPGSPELGAEGEAGDSEGAYVSQDAASGYEEASAVTIDGESQDPALLARAVRTVLKRDEQGK